jgi:hypothetical protein
MNVVCPYGNPDQVTQGFSMHKLLFALLAGLLAVPVALAQGGDTRVAVEMPAMMQEHMRANMRDHLNAINEIQGLLAAGKYDAAADLAEKRIGMSSLEAHGASHMAGFMPQGMQNTGTALHQSASRFAVTAQEAAVTRDLSRALGALSTVTQQCVACHAGYRLK